MVTEQNELWRFDPPSAAFTLVGAISCPVEASGSTPFSMAVDHHGTAYVVFDDGELFTVSTATAACTPSSAPLDTSAFTPTFGMGFTADPGGLGETLYLAGTTSPGQLGTLDTSTFVAQPIAAFSSDIGEAELTGTGDGRLFAFGVDPMLSGSHLAEIDKANAAILSDTVVPTPSSPSALGLRLLGRRLLLLHRRPRGHVHGRPLPPDGRLVRPVVRGDAERDHHGRRRLHLRAAMT